MPPLALANGFFLGRHHTLFREASLATRMLASSARLIMRQLMLGRGADEEVHKGVTGNSMLVAQPGPSYDQVLPSMHALTDGIVVLFCKSVDDVAKAQTLIVDREQYRALVLHRSQVCPVFANARIDHAEVDKLPKSAVPQPLMQGAQFMPEASDVKTTIHGPANRIPMFARPAASDTETDSNQSDNESPIDAPSAAACDASSSVHLADDLNSGSGDINPASVPGANLVAEVLNEHETIIGVDEESCPKPLRLMEAWQAHFETLNAEGAKFAQASMQALGDGDSVACGAQKAAIK